MRRLLVRTAIVLLAARLLWMYLVPAWGRIETDFPNYYTAAWAVANSRPLADLYDPEWFQRETERAGIPDRVALFNYFTPFSALVMWPIADFSPLGAKRIWVIVNVCSLIAVILLVAKCLGASPENVLLVALLGGDALGNNFTFGQFYIVLTLLLVATVVFLTRWPVLAGLCLSLATVVKVFPAVLLGHIAMLRSWRAFFWTLLGIVTLSIVGMVVMGWLPHRVYLEEVFARTLRGEIQDPYSIQWNTLQALLRRSLVAEPGLNPEPIVNAPVVFFFLRPFLSALILIGTLVALRGRKLTLIEFGVLIAAVSLTTPSQASYHQILFFPAIAAAIHRETDLRRQILWTSAFALMCSNYMGAFARFDSGPAMILAFPRAYIVLAFWFAFAGRPLFTGFSRSVLIAATAIGVISAIPEYRRWNADAHDGAMMVRPQESGLMETHPSVGSAGLTLSSLVREGYTLVHPSALGDGLVYESNGAILGRLPDGTEVNGPNLSEPALAMNSVIAIGEGDVLLEKFGRSDWRELFRRNSIVHDPAISIDGTSIAFSEQTAGRYSILEWNRVTGEIRTLLTGSGDYRYPKYSPAGDWLAFSTNESGNWDIGRISLKDGSREILTTSKANDFMPTFAPDGNTVYFASDRRRGYRFTAIYAIALSR